MPRNWATANKAALSISSDLTPLGRLVLHFQALHSRKAASGVQVALSHDYRQFCRLAVGAQSIGKPP